MAPQYRFFGTQPYMTNHHFKHKNAEFGFLAELKFSKGIWTWTTLFWLSWRVYIFWNDIADAKRFVPWLPMASIDCLALCRIQQREILTLLKENGIKAGAPALFSRRCSRTWIPCWLSTEEFLSNMMFDGNFSLNGFWISICTAKRRELSAR